MLDAPRNLNPITTSQALPEDAEATVRRYQRAVWFVLALIASAEIVFGMWLVGMVEGR